MNKKELIASIKRRINTYKLNISGLETVQKQYPSDSNIYRAIEEALADIRGCFQAYYKMGNVPELDTSLKIIESALKDYEKETILLQNRCLALAAQRNEFRDFCLVMCRNIKFEFNPKDLTISAASVDKIKEYCYYSTITKIVNEYNINKCL